MMRRFAILILGLSLVGTVALARPVIFTTPKPSKVYYFSTSGSDSNDCLSEVTACQTLAKAQSIAYRSGDFLGFKGGDVFNGCLFLTEANVKTNPSNPFMVGRYGTGYPTINQTCGNKLFRRGAINLSVSGVTIQDLWLTSSGNSYNAIYIYNTSSSPLTGIVIRRIQSRSFFVAGMTVIETYQIENSGGHIYFRGWEGVHGVIGIEGVSPCLIEDNVMYGASPLAQDVVGLVSNGGGQFRNCTARGNHVFNMGGVPDLTSIVTRADYIGNGLLWSNTVNSLLEYNVTHDIGGNADRCGGPVGVWNHASYSGTIRFNEAFRTRPLNATTGNPELFARGCDFNGVGLDDAASAVRYAVVENNYSHDNAGAGIYMFHTKPNLAGTECCGSAYNHFRYNISINNNLLRLTGFGEFGIGPSSSVNLGPIYVHNNLFWENPSGAPNAVGVAAVGGQVGMGTFFANNIFRTNTNTFGQCVLFQGNGNNWVSQLDLAGNNWFCGSGSFQVLNWLTSNVNYSSYAAWQAVTGEPGAVLTNPLLTGVPTPAPICGGNDPADYPCPFTTTLQAGSPLRGVGRDVIAEFNPLLPIGPNPNFNSDLVSIRDYYGNTVPHGVGTGYNIGPGDIAPTRPYIDLTASTFASNAAQGTAIGTVSIANDPGGVWACTLQNHSHERTQMSGMSLQVGPTPTNTVDRNPGVNINAHVLIRIGCTNDTISLKRQVLLTVTP